MADVRSYMTNKGYEEYKNAKHLSEEESKKDPENDPFRSKYKAREILVAMRGTISEFNAEQQQQEGRKEDEDELLKRFLVAGLNVKLGINYVETEELGIGEEHLTKALKDIEEHKLNKLACNIYQEALNNLGILWSHRGEFWMDNAVKFLEKSEEIYNSFKHEVGGAPYSMEELFRPEEGEDNDQIEHDRNSHFENTYTHSMFYLAQAYAGKGDKELSAKYCHQTLLRQLESGQYNPLEWAVNAASLSQYYLTVEDFVMARHCLASASHILQEAVSKQQQEGSIKQNESSPPSSSNDEDEKDNLARRKADISRCWAKYGLQLLESSREFSIMNLIGHLDRTDLVKNKNNKSSSDEGADHNADKSTTTTTTTDTTDTTNANATTSEAAAKKDITEHTGNLDKDTARFKLELTDIEEEIPAKYVKDFSEARAVFLTVQKWLNEAKEYYVMDCYCNDFVEVSQDQSKAYKLLACFETDQDRQCKMHKRRIDLVSKLLQDLNPQHYLHVCRQLMYELADTYTGMLDIKLNMNQDSSQASTPHSVKKINTLVSQSIKHYMDYINSLKAGKSKLPTDMDEADIRPALVAYFCMGNLYSKFICPDTELKIQNVRNSLDCFHVIADYCRDDPRGQAAVANELHICEEMIELLPRKIQQIRIDPNF